MVGAICLVCSTGAVRAQSGIESVRIGIVAFQDFERRFEDWERILSRAAPRAPGMQFQLALGTYSDVLHWLDRGEIDVGVLTPGVYVEAMRRKRVDYIASIAMLPAANNLAAPARRRPGAHYSYDSICVVAENSPIRSIDDLTAAFRQGPIAFLFVSPDSASGGIAPLLALRRIGVAPNREQVQYTYSHSNSLRLAAQADAKLPRVAFVWDDAARDAPELAAKVRRIVFPALEELSIPTDVIAVRKGFKHGERLAQLVSAADDVGGGFACARVPEAPRQFERLGEWMGTMTDPADTERGQFVSLAEIAQSLLQYSRTQSRPPRLAVVFSGGGAKCAFQVGAVAAVEEQLDELRREHPRQPGLDIALVIGTSGGAINTLPVALGTTATAEGREDLKRVWISLDQRKIVRPSRLVRGNMGLWFFFLQASLAWGIAQLPLVPGERRTRVAGAILVLFGLAQLIARQWPWSPWHWLGQNHVVHHIWLWAGFGLSGSTVWSLAVGMPVLIVDVIFPDGRFRLSWPARRVGLVLAVGIVGLPIAQAYTIFLYETTLSSGDGIEHELAEKFAGLIDRHLLRSDQPILDVSGAATAAERLQAISRQVIDRRLLIRDLVVTGSCLSPGSLQLPSDLYFYVSAEPNRQEPSYARQGVSLRQYASILLDAIMGSGSIFPVFPPRLIVDFPKPGEHIDLIDGGFAHNSPIEAAVRWGATHVILLEATPEHRISRRNFFENSMSAFSHLYAQAQLADVRSKEQVTIFTLTPTAPRLCVLDFADNLISAAIDAGYDRARGTSAERADGLQAPNFRKELGPPFFSRIVVEKPAHASP
jgi:predicted acylesterase/phospholipase RssA/ABC-type phosphate/phosphonate transport system substrate-binding protein